MCIKPVLTFGHIIFSPFIKNNVISSPFRIGPSSAKKIPKVFILMVHVNWNRYKISTSHNKSKQGGMKVSVFISGIYVKVDDLL